MRTVITFLRGRAIQFGTCAEAIVIAAGLLFPAHSWAANDTVMAEAQNGDTYGRSRFIDLSLLVAEGLPCTPSRGFPRFRFERVQQVGTESAYNVETLVIDGNTGTQMDVPSHSVTRPELGLANSGVFGSEFIHTAPVWKFVGEACVVDVQNLLDQAPPGVSPLIGPERILAWETANRPMQRGDVVLFRSGYSDRYYLPLPAGRRYQADPREGRVPAWPDPLPATMELLAGQRQVQHIGCDSPTMGPIPALAEATHFAALKYGAVFTEALTGLGQLPEQRAFYCMMGPKHRDGPYGEGRAFAIVGNPLAARLIESAREKRVVDLSVTNSIDHPITWPGRGADRHRQPYTKNDVLWAGHLKMYHHGHTMDSGAGTHMLTPAYALPMRRLDGSKFPPGVRDWHREFEERYGALGGSDRTAEKISLAQTCGWSRVIDVSGLVGTTDRTQWPTSPQITVEIIKRYEATTGPLRPDEIVLLCSGHTDRTFKPFGEGKACMAAPLAGESEGWPALGADAVGYLHAKGIRCVGTDSPTLGGVDEKQALLTYWSLGSHDMIGVEFLTNLGALPDKAFFLFAPVKIQGGHSAPGRAIGLY